jgi:predicted nucleotidyltransferase component of viral defense system
VIDLIRQRLASYKAANAIEEEQATKEILQEVALYLLWRGGFFEVAAFQGGTSLRILHKLPRFSEDLDFILQQPNREFDWSRYLKTLVSGLTEFGLQSEVLDRSKVDRDIREAMLKNDSIANQLNLQFREAHDSPTVKIKLEIDINPPAGSGFAYTYLDFPLDYEVCHQDLPSNFALKIHALLCRPYVKGRDWFDFNWYIKQKIQPNLTHLGFALAQAGPWKNQKIEIDADWVVARLREKIVSLDWKAAAADVERFLGLAERESVKLWSTRFFSARVGEIARAR